MKQVMIKEEECALNDINDSDLDLLLEDLKVLDEEDISDSDDEMK